jgi:hypothetical protein
LSNAQVLQTDADKKLRVSEAKAVKPQITKWSHFAISLP